MNLSFLKDIYVVFKKMARNGRKTAIYQSQILVISLYYFHPLGPTPLLTASFFGGAMADSLDPKLLGFVICSGLALHYFQKNWLISALALKNSIYCQVLYWSHEASLKVR